jgi:hypothetical protein
MATLRDCIERFHAARPEWPRAPLTLGAGSVSSAETTAGDSTVETQHLVFRPASVPSLPTEFGPLLRHFRRAHPGQTRAGWGHPAEPCLSQNALARRAGIDVAYVNRLEHGVQAPSYRAVLALAGALGLTRANTRRLLLAGGYGAVRIGRAS